MKQVNLTHTHIADLTRSEKLEISMKRSGVTYVDVANAIGVSRSAIVKMLRADSIPTYRHAQLVQVGIPSQLLPPARDIAPGPKRKESSEDSESNYLEQAA